MKSARIEPDAESELREAALWYKERSPDVARRFLKEARAVARAIAHRPLRFPELVEPSLVPPVRRALFPTFPYALVFIVAGDGPRILAVAHQHRLPGYWLYRLMQKP